jgi:lipopolysaccharide heptosyltransferase I
MPKRVLIIRLSAVGDTILNLPIACALKRYFPDTEVGWAVARGAADLLDGHSAIDRLFVMPPEANRSISAYLQFAKGLRQWKPEVAIDAQGLTKSSLLGLLARAPTRIGLSHSEFEGRELSAWINNKIVVPQSTHVIERGLELLRPLGITDPEIQYQVPDRPEIRERVLSKIDSLGLESDWAMINVGAGWESKIWPNDRYAAVARHFAQRWNLKTCVVWGSDKERLAAEQVVALAGGDAVLAPRTTLSELAQWIRCARVFVGSDTGPMHLACAVGVPTVALIGPMPLERVGPKGTGRVSVQKEVLNSNQRRLRKTQVGPMLSIDVPSVIQACDTVMQSFRASRSVA